MTAKDWEDFCTELDEALQNNDDIGWVFRLKTRWAPTKPEASPFWGLEVDREAEGEENLETDITVYRSESYEEMKRTVDKEVKPYRTKLKLTWTGNRLKVG